MKIKVTCVVALLFVLVSVPVRAADRPNFVFSMTDNNALKDQSNALEEQKGVIAQLKDLVCLDHPDAEVCAE